MITSADVAVPIAIAKDVITGIAAGVAIYVGVAGLRTWKKQLIGKENLEVSRGLLSSLYQVREAVRYVRNSWMSAEEMAEARQAAGLTGEPKPDENLQVHGYNFRLQKLSTALVEFDARKLEAEVLWGPEITQLAKPLHQCVRELFIALGEWLQRSQFPIDTPRLTEIHQVIFDYARKDGNEYSNRLSEAIAGIEAEVRKHLSKL